MTDIVRSTDRLRAALVLVATFATVVFNVLASTGRIGGATPKMISDAYPTILTPADYAFSIWGLIYLGLVAFSIFQLLPNNAGRFRAVRSLYILGCVLNCGWVYFFHYDQIWICLIVIAMLWAVLLLTMGRLAGCATIREIWMMQAPLGLYFGWISVAMIINAMVFLKSIESPAASSAVLGSALITAVAFSGVIVRLRLRNFFYPLAVAWALTAMAVKQSGNTAIVVAAAVGVVICLITTGSFVVNLRDSTSE